MATTTTESAGRARLPLIALLLGNAVSLIGSTLTTLAVPQQAVLDIDRDDLLSTRVVHQSSHLADLLVTGGQHVAADGGREIDRHDALLL